MNKKNGFTLTEILVVVAIVAVIAIIAIPSILVINKNMNERIYNKKIDLIESAAELYGLNNPDVFNATNEEYVTVEQLIEGGFLEPDVSEEDARCGRPSGCIINPACKDSECSMNGITILITKESAGVIAEINGKKCDDESSNKKCKGGTLVQQVCEKFNDGSFVGKSSEGAEYCGCKMENGLPTGIFKIVSREENNIIFGEEVEACIISGDENKNYLQYDNVMWRVVGVYNLYNDGNKLVAKIITNDTVDIN